MQNRTESENVTVAEAGRILGASESTVWRMIRRGALTSFRRRGRRLIPRAAVEKQAISGGDDNVTVFDENHPMFRLIGAGRGGGATPGARDKHAILDQ